MELWKDKAVFRDLIVAASHQFEIPTFFVEKDFYLMSVLQHAAAVCPALVFRGGTSLSKAYRAINRFSEDLDLSVLLPSNFVEETASRLQYEELLLSPVLKSLKAIGFAAPWEVNEGSSLKYYCVYQKIDSPLFFNNGVFDSRLKLESTLLSKPYPTERKRVSSYIYSFLRSENQSALIAKYHLCDFEVQVQSIARTAIDKMCAICDYYLEKKPRRNSRHLYDLFEISRKIDFSTDDFRLLAQKVYQERKGMERAYSANDGVSMNALFKAMVKNGFYQEDYRQITKPILFSKAGVSYEDAVSILQRIVDLNLFV
jgi:predicted nucleotidyltransferase component of viral defense system